MIAALIAALATTLAIFALALRHGGVRRALVLAAREALAEILPPKIIIVGDSLAEQPDWRRLHSAPFSTLNLSRGGATLKEIGGQIAYARRFRPQWLLIDGGLNDILFDDAPLAQIDYDFRAVLRRVDPDWRVIVTLMPYVADARRAPRIDEANARLMQLCAEHGAATLDLNPRLCEAGARRPEMSYDGLHFSRAADALWLAELRRMIAP